MIGVRTYPDNYVKDSKTLILASQDGSAVKVTKTLNREDIHSSLTTRKQTVGCLCIVNISQTSYQTSTILPRGSSFFPRHRCGSFMLVSPTVHSRVFGSTQVLEETEGSFLCTRLLKKWGKTCVIFYLPCML